jgi:hypothetical protein
VNIYRVKLSKGALLLLHLAAVGHVWRDFNGSWVASTVHTKRCVDQRVKKLIDQGMLSARFDESFPKVTEMGRMYLRDHPVEKALQAKSLR